MKLQMRYIFFFKMYMTLLFSAPVFSQITFEKHFGKNYYNVGSCVYQTDDDGYIIAGWTGDLYGPPEEGEVRTKDYVVKTDKYGALLWDNSYFKNDTGYSEATAAAQTNDGGYIIAVNNFSSHKGCLIKTDSQGNSQWIKTYQEKFTTEFNDLMKLDDGGFLALGATGDTLHNGDTYLIRTDENGLVIWSKVYEQNYNNGGVSFEKTPDGGYVILGWMEGQNQYYADMYLMKINENGEILWTHTFSNNYPATVKITSDSGYAICGTSSDYTCRKATLIKTDEKGNIKWEKVFGDTCNFWHSAAAQQTADGGYIIAGTNYYGLDYHIVIYKTNSSGDTLWTKKYRGTGTNSDAGAGCLIQTKDKGFVITGDTRSLEFSVERSVYLLKLNQNGNLTETEADCSNGIVRLYPNPFSTSAVIQIPYYSDTGVKFEIYDVSGKLVAQYPTEYTTFEIDGQNLAVGTYIYKLSSACKKPPHGKFIIINR